MSLALDASTPAFVASSANPVSTATFSPPANSALFALCSADTSNTFSVSGGGLTWTQIASRNAGGGADASAAVFFAWNASAQTNITVSSTRTGSFTANAIKVLVFTGGESTYGGATATGATDTVSVTTTRAGSWVWACCVDENGGGGQTAATGCTINDGFTFNNGIDQGIVKATSITANSGTAVAVGTSNSVQPTTITFEVRAASGGGGLSQLLNPAPTNRARLVRASCF